MRTRLFRLGIRKIRAEKGRVVIQPDRAPRHGWDRAFALMAARRGDKPLLERAINTFDRDEWTW